MDGRHRWYRLAALCAVSAWLGAAVGEDWPQFRGPRRDDTARETGLMRQWPAGGPRVLWTTPVCEGYAAAAIHSDRVYLEDYSRETKEWQLRCLNLSGGRELWRLSEVKDKGIRANHGITRATPATDGLYVFALDPKCVLHGVDAASGRELWRKDLVDTYQTQIPPWYNGQCPLIEADRVVVAPGGSALMVALRKDTGEEIWRTPNPERWLMTHASVMPAELCGVKQYLWCTLAGPLGVAADDGRLLWSFPRKFNVAVAPSPLAIGADRVFMTAGYEAGSVMLRVRSDGGHFTAETVFDWGAEEWNSEVHTPVLFENHMLAVGKKQRGLLTCLDLDGKTVWTSAGRASFGLGGYLLADGLLFILDGDSGLLRLLETSTAEYRELASAPLLSGDNVWAPMALSDGKLVLRDMSKMICVEVGPSKTSRAKPEAAPSEAAAGTRIAMVSLPASRGSREPALHYQRVRIISGKGPEKAQFSGDLRGIALDGQDRLHVVGDTDVKVFTPEGELLRSWPTELPGYCVAIGSDGRVYVGQAGQVEVFDAYGQVLATWRDRGSEHPPRLGLVTAIGVVGDDVVIADTEDRCLHRYDRDGKFTSDIGKDNRMKGFLVPNRHLDLALDRAGVIHVANPGLHRVERYNLAGELLGQFGRFDGHDPAGFTGCCNPTNVALTPRGFIAVTEKAPPRAKIYDSAGILLAVMGEQDFDPACKNMDIAVDSQERVYVVDTVRLHICLFAPAGAPTGSQPSESDQSGAGRP